MANEVQDMRTQLAQMKARLAVIELKRAYGKMFWLNYNFWEDVMLNCMLYPAGATFGTGR